MKIYPWLFFMCILSFASKGQNSVELENKPPLDSSVMGNWPIFWGRPVIRDDGRFSAFIVNRFPGKNKTLMVKKNDGTWEKQMLAKDIDENIMFFTADNHFFVFQQSDSIMLLSLDNGNISKIYPVSKYAVPGNNMGEWVAYKMKAQEEELVLHNLITKRQLRFTGVKNYQFSDNGKTFVIKADTKHGSIDSGCVKWIDLLTQDIRVIWSDTAKNIKNVNSFSFDSSGAQLVFIVSGSPNGESSSNSIWYYKTDRQKAGLLVNSKPLVLDSNMAVANYGVYFSLNGKWVFFYLEGSNIKENEGPTGSRVNVWSYRDAIIQPDQMRLQSEEYRQKYWGVIASNGGDVARLQQDGDEINTFPMSITGDYLVLKTESRTPYWWTHSPKSKVYLVSLKTGKRRVLVENGNRIADCFFSTTGRFLIYWDLIEKTFFCYDVTTDKRVNLCGDISRLFVYDYYKGMENLTVSFRPAGWFKDDQYLMLYDNYDIWKFDPLGKMKPVNLTNGFGAKMNIKFRLIDEQASGRDKKIFYLNSDTLLLTAFSNSTKLNGFYKMPLGAMRNPLQLTMGPYTFFKTDSQVGGFYTFFGNSMQPAKALKANAWIVQRSSCEEAPNYYFTRDFKDLFPLTNFRPQKSYNWMTSELVTWKAFDGTPLQGILYKPENFDPQRKYPVIFNYYEKLSHRMYEFIYPGYQGQNLNISWFVSKGYLVFTPDIIYRPAKKYNKTVGEWALNSVLSAAKHLSRLPYVDSSRMALQGHSFGGMQTGYIVTHTSFFAAACEAAGTMDPISTYLTLIPLFAKFEHSSTQETLETGHSIFGATLWERPDLYHRNSAVLNADKVTTPLLIMHNKNDNQIQWNQGVEMYMAMRRLEKKCWMLQYDDAGHYVIGDDAKDYTIRMMQFFDHYLKDAPAPRWMTQSIPYALKGIENRYELDPVGNCGKDCKVCKLWNKKPVTNSVLKEQSR